MSTPVPLGSLFHEGAVLARSPVSGAENVEHSISFERQATVVNHKGCPRR